ncbi:MAG TPA: flagellar motor protein MotB [Chromobacteriaceae bacterium]|nr:flagellar motor protein MotB [Chromobacteriaceae bacterium]
MTPAKGQKLQEEAIVKRVSRKHDDDGHGGAWKVAFADFCLALMCLFLVLWVLASRSKEQLESIMASGSGPQDLSRGDKMMDNITNPAGSLISREPIPGKGGGNPGPATSPDPETKLTKTHYDSPADMKELATVLAKLSDESGLAGNLQTIITPYGLRVMLHDTDKQGMFQRGSAVPSDPFRQLLHRLGPLFSRITNQMLVVGHTDAKQYRGQGGAAFSNWSLSSNRAMAARANLLEGGMKAQSVLQVVGMADRAPLNAHDPEGAVNRRIELLILTPGQAKLISQMYGMPRDVVPLAPGVDSVTPDKAALEKLRGAVKPAAH